MIELTYFQFAAFLIIVLIIGIGLTCRLERNRYENIIDIFRTKNDKLSEALRDEMLKNEKLENALSEKTMKIDRLKKRLNSLYGEK